MSAVPEAVPAEPTEPTAAIDGCRTCGRYSLPGEEHACPTVSMVGWPDWMIDLWMATEVRS